MHPLERITRIPVADAHTHIHRSKSAIHLIAQARRTLVQPLIVCATSEADFDDVTSLASTTSDIVPNFGVHPWWATTASLSLSDNLEARLEASPNAACGEIGLDASPRGILASPFEQQVKVFKSQLRIASKLKRPISVHCVQAYGPFLDAISECEQEQEGTVLNGVLMHSFAGTCGFAHQLITQRGKGGKGDAAPYLLFSFNGGVVSSASNAFDELRDTKQLQSGVSDLSSTERQLPEKKKVFRLRGLSKDSLKVLQRLPHSHLCFETDTPDQPFLHHVSNDYLSWCRKVFEKDIEEEEAENDDLGVSAEVESTCTISCCDDETIKRLQDQEQHSTSSSVENRLPVEEGSLEHYREKEKLAKENRPVLVRHVLRAAAILRYSYGSRAAGLPLQQKPGALAADEVERKSMCPSDGLAFLSVEPESLPPHVITGLRKEYTELCISSTNNVKSMFQWMSRE